MANRGFTEKTLDFLSIPEYVKKLEENKSSPFLTESTNNGDRHRVRHYLVAMARFMVVFLQFRKSRKMRQAKACDSSGQPVIYRTLAKTSEEWVSENSSYFVTDRSFTADGGLL